MATKALDDAQKVLKQQDASVKNSVISDPLWYRRGKLQRLSSWGLRFSLLHPVPLLQHELFLRAALNGLGDLRHADGYMPDRTTDPDGEEWGRIRVFLEVLLSFGGAEAAMRRPFKADNTALPNVPRLCAELVFSHDDPGYRWKRS